jgi:hypothetical protein
MRYIALKTDLDPYIDCHITNEKKPVLTSVDSLSQRSAASRKGNLRYIKKVLLLKYLDLEIINEIQTQSCSSNFVQTLYFSIYTLIEIENTSDTKKCLQ